MRAIHRILCPVDLSDVSRHAIAHAEQLARWYKASITALHVCNPIVIPPTDVSLIGAYTHPVLSDHDIEAVRRQVTRWFPDRKEIQVDAIVQSGEIWKRIVDSATALPADLIVIGTHGSGGFQHLMLGSVAEKVLRRAPCPVLTVPPFAQTTSKMPFERILCPIDFSAPSLEAFEFARSLAVEGHATVRIVHIVESADEPLRARPMLTSEYRHGLERDACAKMTTLLKEATDDRSRLSTLVGYGKPYEEILRIASDEHCDLIVMGVHGRNALDISLFGSTANQVVRRATCPVLTVRR